MTGHLPGPRSGVAAAGRPGGPRSSFAAGGRPGRRRRGFTFIEVMVALIYLSTVMVFLVNFFSTSTAGTLDANRETVAYLLAQEGLEWVSSQDYRTLWMLMKSKSDSRIANDPNLRNLANFVEDASPQATKQIYPEIAYPKEFFGFDRRVALAPAGDGLIKVSVIVETAGGFFMRRGRVKLLKLVGRGQ